MLTLLPVLMAAASCGVATQPVSSETVAAYEVSLPLPADRAAFLAVLRDAARAEGAHLDAATDRELRETGVAIPQAKMTIYAAVWQGSEDEGSWATIMDQADHLGKVWVMFSRGEDELQASRFRVRTMRSIKARWPGTLSLPVINHRTIPLSRDLVKTPEGYRINPTAVSAYRREPDA